MSSSAKGLTDPSSGGDRDARLLAGEGRTRRLTLWHGQEEEAGTSLGTKVFLTVTVIVPAMAHMHLAFQRLDERSPGYGP